MNNVSLDQIIEIVKGSGAAIIAALLLYGGIWIRGVFKQKQRNEIDEIDLSAKKIDFDTHNKPINDLVSESNKGHGANDVVKESGNDDKKGK